MRNDSIADREPCPWRIIDDIGGAFSMGAIGGGAFHVIRGSWNAPSNSRFVGGINAMAARGPVLGGQFAVWGGMFACCDCTLTAIRQKEDPWNSIISGATTGGILAARAGPKAVAQAAAIGGVLLALIEGMGIMITKSMSPPLPTPEEMASAGVSDPTAPPVSGGMILNSLGNAPKSPYSSETNDDTPSSEDPFAVLAGKRSGSDSFGTETTFSTGETSKSNPTQESQESNWWPFGAK